MTIPNTPLRRYARDEAPEITALDQPNSPARELKKTPYDTKVPTPTA
jgi:hypothetical protein